MCTHIRTETESAVLYRAGCAKLAPAIREFNSDHYQWFNGGCSAALGSPFATPDERNYELLLLTYWLLITLGTNHSTGMPYFGELEYFFIFYFSQIALAHYHLLGFKEYICMFFFF